MGIVNHSFLFLNNFFQDIRMEELSQLLSQEQSHTESKS